MDLIEQYRALARYNSWMNRKVYLLSSALNDDQRKRDRGAFFRSIHGTLNHLLLTDRVQVSRFAAQPLVSRDQSGNAIEIRALSQELYADFEVLRREREETDRFHRGLDPGPDTRSDRWRPALPCSGRRELASAPQVVGDHAHVQPSDASSGTNHPDAPGSGV